jgi:hypothetical protein
MLHSLFQSFAPNENAKLAETTPMGNTSKLWGARTGYVASTPVASFTPSRWNVITMVRGAWEADEPFRSDLICASGGALYDAVLPIGGDVEAKLRAIPADDPRRRERAAVLLNQHDDGLPPD